MKLMKTAYKTLLFLKVYETPCDYIFSLYSRYNCTVHEIYSIYCYAKNHSLQSNCYEISNNPIGGDRLSSVDNTLMGTVSSAEFGRLEDP